MKEAIDLFNVYRDYAKHVDDLINHRISWNLTVQVRRLRSSGGLRTIVLISICAAVLALRTLDNQWQDLAIEHKERLPAMTGGGSKLAMRLGHFAQLGVPAGIVVAWLYIYEQIPL